MNFSPRNPKHNLCLVLFGKATWALCYAVASLLVGCVLVNMIGFGPYAIEALKWSFPHFMEAINFLLCATALGALWEAIAPH
jgi:hypothetical protein